MGEEQKRGEREEGEERVTACDGIPRERDALALLSRSLSLSLSLSLSRNCYLPSVDISVCDII